MGCQTCWWHARLLRVMTLQDNWACQFAMYESRSHIEGLHPTQHGGHLLTQWTHAH